LGQVIIKRILLVTRRNKTKVEEKEQSAEKATLFDLNSRRKLLDIKDERFK